MTPDKDAEIARLRRELEIAFDVAREIGEERNELALALGREVATTQRLRAALHKARIAVQFGRVLSAAIKEEYDRDPDVARFDAVADEFDAALASDNDGGNDGTG